MMRQFLIDLLKRLEAAVPPPPKCHHAITFARYGSDEVGWTDKLALQVNANHTFYCFFLEEDDLPDDPQRVIDYVVKSLASPEITKIMQKGVGPAQYLADRGKRA
jgi:hypothetical protein